MSRYAQMNKTASIYRPATSRSGTGTVTRAVPDTPESTSRCALMPGKGETVATEGGLMLEADAAAYFPAGADLRPQTNSADATGQGDVVEIDSVRYRVLAVVDQAGRNKILKALLKREA